MDVFKYGRQKLANTVAIQTEISFMPLWKRGADCVRHADGPCADWELTEHSRFQ